METRKLEKRKSANFGQMECRRDFVAKEDNWRFGLARKFLKIERTAWKRTRQVVAGRSFQLTGQTRTFTIIIPRLLAVESVHTFLHGIISFDFVAILILLSLLFPSFLFFSCITPRQWISKIRFDRQYWYERKRNEKNVEIN